MTENKKPGARGVSIRSPADVQRIARRVISDIFQERGQIEHAGKINQLLITWLKAFEIEKLSDLEKRITDLEKEKGERR